jgi:hypothetical protein
MPLIDSALRDALLEGLTHRPEHGESRQPDTAGRLLTDEPQSEFADYRNLELQGKGCS